MPPLTTPFQKTPWTILLPTLFVGLMFSVFNWAFQRNDATHSAETFETQVNETHHALAHRLDIESNNLRALAALLQNTPSPSLDTFERTARIWIDPYAGVSHYGWAPKVSAEQRIDFESRLGQPVVQRTADGTLSAADAAPYHLPLQWLAPSDSPNAGPNTSQGMDMLSVPAVRAAMDTSLTSGRPTLTPPMPLLDMPNTRLGMVMLQAVTRPAARTPSVLNPTDVQGAVVALIDPVDLLNNTVDAGTLEAVRWCWVDRTGGANQRLAGDPGCEAATPSTDARRDWVAHRTIDVAGRHLSLRAEAKSPNGYDSPTSWMRPWLLALSIAAVSALGFLLWYIVRQRQEAQELVMTRTEELVRSNAKLQQLAHFDPLTGLANRTELMNQASRALASAQRFNDLVAVMFLDLDNFKLINDSMGHQTGDALLQSVARRLEKLLRNIDLVARLGGDEFVVLIPRLPHKEHVNTVAQKIIDSLREPVVLNGKPMTVSTSIGIALYPDDAYDLNTLLSHADIAMYAAKTAGRNCYRFFNRELHDQLNQRLAIESGLRHAIHTPHNELFLEFQPQVDARTLQPVGVEALVRWNHPTLGLLMPDRFMKIAEESGLSDELGQWVLTQACQRLADWQADGHPLKGVSLAVNVSVLQFQHHRFVEQLQHLLVSHRLSATLLELELTESLLMKNWSNLDMQVTTLSNMGVRLALDDFGTGYTNLYHLKRLPLQRIKIDKSFIHGVPGRPNDEAIVRASLHMAKDLGLQVVAEGVENEGQRAFLLKHDCHHLQGWLVARAMTEDRLVQWFSIAQHPNA